MRSEARSPVRRAAIGAIATLVVAVIVSARAHAQPGDPPPGGEPPAPGTVTIVSKNFAENRLLAEMFAQLIEARAGLRVERRFNLVGTQPCFDAVRTGEADIYAEYTGTGLLSILKAAPDGDPARVLAKVRADFRARWDLEWLAPLGFENSYEIAVRRELAERHGLATISDLVPHGQTLRAGVGFEFVDRPDGLPGLREAYGLELGTVTKFQQTLKFQSAIAGEIDVLDVYTTDGRIDLSQLVVLEDDRRFFPPYQACTLVRRDLLRRHPEVGLALNTLAGVLDVDRMRALNRRLQDDAEPVERVAADALRELAGQSAGPRRLEQLALPAYFWRERGAIATNAGRHLVLVAISLALAIALAVPLGVALERRRALAEPTIRGVGLIQTIPSIALLAFAIPILGTGMQPAVAALFLYSLFPIVRATFTGVRDADPTACEAARALGMTPGQVLARVRLPLAAPIIMAGVRTAAVINVGTATLAAFIGAGGLGDPIVSGLQQMDTQAILSGAIPAAALAVLVDVVLAGSERLVRPRGLA